MIGLRYSRAYLSLGSNVARERNLPAAVRLLAERVELRAMSRIYDTEAVGDSVVRPSFFNAAAEIETEAAAPDRFRRDVIAAIEADLGRIRTRDPNEPRTIDLDIVWWLGPDGPPPDPGILVLRHLAEPLAEIAPDLRHPGSGESIREIAERLARDRHHVRCEPVALAGWDEARARLLRTPGPGP